MSSEKGPSSLPATDNPDAGVVTAVVLAPSPPPPPAPAPAPSPATATSTATAPAISAQDPPESPKGIVMDTKPQPAPKASGKSAITPVSRTASQFSWMKPHPLFVIILVGPDEIPFALQKDFLCAQSTHYERYFSAKDADLVEAIVKLPDTSAEVFGLAQHFMYTGSVFPDDAEMPSYEVLVSVWKLGHDLGIEGLRDRTLETMIEVRQATGRIPGAPLLVQVWRDTPEGSPIRILLLAWAAEYMRSSESNAEFAKSLPQEVLSELVLAMSKPDTTPLVQLGADEAATPSAIDQLRPTQVRRKTVHYIDEEEEQDEYETPYLLNKKQRRSDPFVAGSVPKPVARKAKSAAVAKAIPRRRSNPAANGETQEFSEEQKLSFCQDLLVRMLSGPGFWTRLVGPFREPVDPVRDQIPDYYEKVPKPMDLVTMKGKMERNEYASHEEFFADMKLIFSNCKTYWKPTDSIFAACDKLEKTFMDKYSGMNKWLSKMEGNEEH